jgi:flagellar motor switch protein FliG
MDSASTIAALDKDGLDTLVDEFAAQFARSLGLSTGFDEVRSLVEQAFSPGELAAMLGPATVVAREPVWKRFEPGSESSLVPYFLDEHPQTIAAVLARLDGNLAARCLSMLPGDLRDSVARRLLKLNHVLPRPLELLEASIERDLLTRSNTGLLDEGRQRVAGLLNKLDREISAGIFEGLSATRPEEARRLRKMIFSFDDIDKLSQPARLALFDKLQTEQVIAALKGMPASFKEIALSSLGARARRMVEAELANDNGQVTREGEASRRTIADLVLAMAARGELELPESGEAAAGAGS